MRRYTLFQVADMLTAAGEVRVSNWLRNKAGEVVGRCESCGDDITDAERYQRYEDALVCEACKEDDA